MIKANCFCGSGIQNILLPIGVKIEDNAFAGCRNLEHIWVNNGCYTDILHEN